MAQFVSPPETTQVTAGTPSVLGIDRILEFTNWDGEYVPYNCGQAAAATFLTFQGKLESTEENAKEYMIEIETAHPPDNMGGYFGTSRRRVERICRSYGAVTEAIDGEDELREMLSQGCPVIVMLGVPGPKFLGYTLPAGHWMVAYAFDENAVYLTNWGAMDWEMFRSGWKALVPSLISMRNKGLVARDRSPDEQPAAEMIA